MYRWIAIFALWCTGCFQTYNEDEGLSTVPVTNNPNVVPSHGSGLPMMGEQGPH